MIVCVCKAVSDRAIARAIAEGAQSVDDVARCTGAGTGCGACRHSVQQALDMTSGRTAKPLIMLPMVALTGS